VRDAFAAKASRANRSSPLVCTSLLAVIIRCYVCSVYGFMYGYYVFYVYVWSLM
jgi:hypothetical protein